MQKASFRITQLIWCLTRSDTNQAANIRLAGDLVKAFLIHALNINFEKMSLCNNVIIAYNHWYILLLIFCGERINNMHLLIIIDHTPLHFEGLLRKKNIVPSYLQNMSLSAASVWSTSPPMASNWANDGAWGALKQSGQMNKTNNNNSLGFWDDAIISTSAPPPQQHNKKQSAKQG